MESKHGAYSVTLPLADGSNAKISGVVIDRITNDFPNYILNGEVENDLRKDFARTRNVKDLPRLFHSVGGQVDIMIGVQFLRYFPTEIFRSWAGLTIYNSCFKSPDGSTGVIAGPHTSFRETNDKFYGFNQPSAFFTFQAQAIRNNDSLERFAPKNHLGEVIHDTTMKNTIT